MISEKANELVTTYGEACKAFAWFGPLSMRDMVRAENALVGFIAALEIASAKAQARFSPESGHASYHDQGRLVPSDQLSDAKATAHREALRNQPIRSDVSDAYADTDEADDIAAMEYQKLLADPKEETTETYHSASVLYPGDQIYFKSKFRPTYQVNIYEKFQHTWEFENTGTQVWRGRRLYFLNHDAVRPRADANYIDIPDTPPHKGVKITVSMDARGFEGKSECKWIMVDNDDNDCFPNSNTFTFFVSAKFEYQK